MSVSIGIMAEIHIAKKYEAAGYTVVPNPRDDLIPFNLEGYIPDILATRGDENILIEVKTSRARVDTEKLFKISKIVQSHPGWKFLVVTVNEDDISELKKTMPGLDINKISRNLIWVEENLKNLDLSVLLLPQIWVCYISILSMHLINEGVEVSKLSDVSILNSAYSEGIVDYQELELAKEFLRLRNFVCHNFAGDISTKNVEAFFKMTQLALNRYKKQVGG